MENLGHWALKELCVQYYYKEPTSISHFFFDVSIPEEAVALAGTCVFSFLFMTSRQTNYLSTALPCHQGAQNRKT